MKEDFRFWLVDIRGLTEITASSRVSNVQRIENYYGSLDILIQTGLANKLLEDLSYSTDDERKNRPAAHRIPIDGNIRNGSATLKQALELYIKFYEYSNGMAKKELVKKTIQNTKPTYEIQSLLSDLKKVLTAFRISNIKASYSDTRNEVRDYIQLPLFWELQKSLPSIDWKMEYKLSDKVGDKIDIFGQVNDNTVIIIEIDTYRSDQICKKFVSRQALSSDMSSIYVVVTYPNNNCSSTSYQIEFEKYKNYLETLVGQLSVGSGLKKYLYIHQL